MSSFAMVKATKLLVLAASLTSALGSTFNARPARRQEGPAGIPSSWVKHSRTEPDDGVKFTLALKGQDMDSLDSKMTSIAEQGDGHWLSDDELHQHVRAHPEHKSTLIKYLNQHGVSNDSIHWSKFDDHATVTTNAQTAHNLFDQPLNRYNHTSSGQTHIKAQSLTIPSQLDFIEHVSNLTTFHTSSTQQPRSGPMPSGMAKRRRMGPKCLSFAVTGACLRWLYNVDSYTPSNSTGKNNTDVLILGLSGQYANSTDLQSYLHSFGTESTNHSTIDIKSAGGVHGHNNASQPGLEASLDIETATVINSPLHNVFWYFDPGQGHSAFEEAFRHILDSDMKPSVISISYGYDENLLSRSQVQHICSLAAKLTAQGTTIVTAAGDSGVSSMKYDSNTTTCAKGFTSTVPSVCPHVVSVGATQTPNRGAEQATPWGGGGFSDYISAPSYQQEAVKSYLDQLGNKNEGKFNRTGRAYPDVAAIGQNFVTVVGGKQGRTWGTSASTPVFAGLLSLANSARHQVGKGNVGFVHPLLYKNSSAFNDITQGQNAGCDGNPTMMTRRSVPTRRHQQRRQPGLAGGLFEGIDSKGDVITEAFLGSVKERDGSTSHDQHALGFPATKGWDAVTGWGSIDLDKLIDIVGGKPSSSDSGQDGSHDGRSGDSA